MCPDSLHAVVNSTGLRGVVQETHNRRRLDCLGLLETTKGCAALRDHHLIVEEVFRQIEGESEEWEEQFPEIDCCVAEVTSE